MNSEALAAYQAYLVEPSKHFAYITYIYLPFQDHQFFNAPAKLGSMMSIPTGTHSMPLSVEMRNEPTHCYTIDLRKDICPHQAEDFHLWPRNDADHYTVLQKKGHRTRCEALKAPSRNNGGMGILDHGFRVVLPLMKSPYGVLCLLCMKIQEHPVL
ncbi:hypothetical protein Cgig2_021442 [Carnegiea gigantea]|uniref:Uncharacterized protein n=1 Tax=Carnegiea gigantea TaxID=171969 RepID=A0A9Q1GS56_9CARY|nr:hypothetical protein Cgig2_021442 [Carnegiea gigantea]